MDCLSIYIDKPLDNIDGAIRLVAILPGRHDDKIYCELRLDHLLGQDNPPKYEALSYVWGTQEYPMEILLDNQPFQVGQNLYVAIRHLRHTAKPRLFWIDAICINQHQLKGPGASPGLTPTTLPFS